MTLSVALMQPADGWQKQTGHLWVLFYSMLLPSDPYEKYFSHFFQPLQSWLCYNWPDKVAEYYWTCCWAYRTASVTAVLPASRTLASNAAARIVWNTAEGARKAVAAGVAIAAVRSASAGTAL